MNTKVRVKREALLKIVEGRTRKAEKDYERASAASAAYPERVAAWEQACIATLEKSLAAAKRGKLPTDRYGNSRVNMPDKPVKPSEGRELCNLRRMLATLKMGVDDALLLSQEDADAYFGPCKL